MGRVNVRLTNETDYALRIMYVLQKERRVISASELSEVTGVTLRFALKILRKLHLAGLISSMKGASGGYILSESAGELTVGVVIETIDGPFKINNCLKSEYECSRMGKDVEECKFHNYFCELNEKIRADMHSMKLADPQ